MLVLGRRIGQKILIGDKIEVLVVDIGGGNVKIGVEAPRNIRILRDELLREDCPVDSVDRVDSDDRGNR